MAGLQMPKKGQGLQSLRDLKDQERSAAQVPTVEDTESSFLTDFRQDGGTEGLTERRNDGGKEGSTEGRKDSREDGQPPVNQAVSPSAIEEGRQPVIPPAQPSVGTGGQESFPRARRLTIKAVAPEPETITDENFAEVVRQAIAAKRVLTGGNKTTVDMTPELAKRAAIYSLDHAKVSARQMFVELLDAFLTLEGY
jgi:hypothetical protein